LTNITLDREAKGQAGIPSSVTVRPRGEAARFLLSQLVQRIEVQRERRHGRASAPHAAVTPDPAIPLWLQLRRLTTPQRNARQIDLLV
jgi:hypothetical protein